MSPKASKRETHSEERHIPGAESLTPATSDTSEAIQRKQEREERQNRIASKVTEMKERLKETDDAYPEWSAPLMVVAFGVVVGYFAYAVIYS